MEGQQDSMEPREEMAEMQSLSGAEEPETQVAEEAEQR